MNDVNTCVCCGQIMMTDDSQVCPSCASEHGNLSAILREATELKARKDEQHLPVDYIDYEYFKQRLHNSGYYGQDKALADVLGL